MNMHTTDLDPRLVKALAHPLRVRIMTVLGSRTATPKELARELRVPLQNLSYHVRALRDNGFLELERTRAVRGALEHSYRASARPRISAEAWAQLPAIVREAFDSAALDQVFDEVGRAASQGKLTRPESHISRISLALDEEGFAEASQIVSDALEELARVEARAKERLGHAPADAPAVAVALLFDAPGPDDGAGSGHPAAGRERVMAHAAHAHP